MFLQKTAIPTSENGLDFNPSGNNGFIEGLILAGGNGFSISWNHFLLNIFILAGRNRFPKHFFTETFSSR